VINTQKIRHNNQAAGIKVQDIFYSFLRVWNLGKVLQMNQEGILEDENNKKTAKIRK